MSAGKALTTVAAVVVIACGVAGTYAYGWGSEQDRTCTVTGTDRTRSSEGGSDMRVYTEGCGVLGVGDVLVRGQFDSADAFGGIEPGVTYEVTTVGWRVPFLSMFPTVLGEPIEVTR